MRRRQPNKYEAKVIRAGIIDGSADHDQWGRPQWNGCEQPNYGKHVDFGSAVFDLYIKAYRHAAYHKRLDIPAEEFDERLRVHEENLAVYYSKDPALARQVIGLKSRVEKLEEK